MSEQPMFYQGQRVVAQVSPPPKGWKNNKHCDLLIDGKSYYVVNPCDQLYSGLVFIEVAGIKESAFWQGDFIPYETDEQINEEIHQALKEDLKVKNFQDN